MYKLVLAGFGNPLIEIFELLNNEFNIIGVIKDYERKSQDALEFNQFIDKNKLKIISFSEIDTYNVDLIFVINFNKIIDVDKIKSIKLINLHIGILPKYRGNNANALSILNNDRNVGYTIHEIIEELDGGNIFYIFKYLIQEDETYFHAKQAMNFDIKSNLSTILLGIIKNEIQPISQKGEEFIYASKLLPEDGIINWNLKTMDILNRKIIFSKPIGTGLKFLHNEVIYEIDSIRKIPGFSISEGFPGAVIMKTSYGSIWVKTKDTAIEILKIVYNNQMINPSDIFKIGQRL